MPDNKDNKKITPRVPSGGTDFDQIQVSRLTAISGLLSLFMFGSDGGDLLNSDDTNSPSKVSRNKSKSPSGGIVKILSDLYKKDKSESINTDLNRICENIESLIDTNKSNTQKEINIKEYQQQVIKHLNILKANSLAQTISFSDQLTEQNEILNELYNNLSDAPGGVNDNLSIISTNTNKILSALENFIDDKKYKPSDSSIISKILIELNGNTDLSKLIETLYLLNDKDISDETVGLIAKLDKIVNAVKTNISTALGIDVSGAIAKINSLDDYFKAVQQIITLIESKELEKIINSKSFNDQINYFETLNRELETTINDEFIESVSKTGNLVKSAVEQIVSIKTEFESLTDSINTINTIFDKLSTVSIGKLPSILDSTSNVFIGNFISKVAEASDELNKFNLSQLSKDFSRIINIITSINESVKAYNEKVGASVDLKLNHFMWHAIPDILLVDSDKFFGKFIQDILNNFNFIALLDYSDASKLLHKVGEAYQALYDGIKDYNSYIKDNNILDIVPFTIDENKLNELKTNVDKLIHFMDSFNEIMSGKVSDKILSNIDTSISQLFGSVKLIDKLNNVINEINQLDIQLVEFKYSINDNFCTQLNEFLIKLNSLNDIFDLNGFEISSELSKFTDIISSIRDIMFKLNAYSFASKNSKQRINLENFAYSINDEFINQLDTFISQLNKLTISFNDDEAKQLDSFISLFEKISSSLFNLKNNILNKSIILDKDTLANFEISDEFNAKLIELSKKIDIKALKNIINNLELLSQLSNQIENVGDISTVKAIYPYIDELITFANKLININVPTQKEMQEKVNQFIEVKRILDVFSQFEPVTFSKIKGADSFIKEITAIAQTTILPEDIEWIIPVTKKIATVSDIINKVDSKNFVLFAEAIYKLQEGFKGIAGLDIQGFKSNIDQLNQIKFEDDKIKIFNQLSNIIANINTTPIPDIDVIKRINEFLNNSENKNTLKGLFDNLVLLIDNVEFNETNIEELEKTSKIIKNGIESLIAITNIKEVPNKKAIEAVNDLIKDNGLIVQIINNIRRNFSDQITKDAENNLKLINNLFDAIIKIGQIKLMDQIRMKFNIWFIKTFLIDDIASIIKEIQRISKRIDKELNNDIFKPFNKLIDSIIKLSEISDKSKIKMIESLFWINNFIVKMVLDLTETLHKASKDVSSDPVYKDMSILKTFIETIIALGDFNLSKLISYSINVKLLRFFINHSIQDLISDIAKLEGIDIAQSHAKSTKEAIEYLNEIFGAIPDIKSITSYLLRTSLLTLGIMPLLIGYVNQFSIIDNISKGIDAESIKKVSNITDEINKIFNKFNLDYRLLYVQTSNAVKTVSNLSKLLKKIINLSELSQDINPDTIKKINTIVSTLNIVFDNVDLSKLSKAADESSKIKDFIKNITPIISFSKKMSKLGKLSDSLESAAKCINKMFEKMIEGIQYFNQLNEDDIKNAEKTLNVYENVVMHAAAILILGAAAMGLIKIENLIAFTGSLSIFIIGIGFAIQLATKNVVNNSESIDAFGELVFKSGLILIFGSLVLSFINKENIIGFTVLLTGFIFGITGAFKWAAKTLNANLEAAKDFTQLVVCSGLILILGSVISHFVTAGDIFTFVGALLTLITGVMGVYIATQAILNKLGIAQPQDIALSYIGLVAVSGMILTMAALISNIIDLDALWTFTENLFVLILGTMAVYVAAQWALNYLGIEKPQDIALSYIGLVAVSGMILLMGSLLSSIIDPANLLSFTLMLGGFIGGVMGIYIWVSNKAKKAKDGIEEFAEIIAVSGILLLAGALITKLIGWEPIVTFGLTLGLFVMGTLWMYGYAAEHSKKAKEGLKDFSLILVTSGILLMIGALIVNNIGWEPIATFGGILAAFVGGVMFIYVVAANMAKKALKGAAEFGILVLCASLSLFIGALTIEQLGGTAEAFLKLGAYAVILGLFVLGLVFIYNTFGKSIEKSIIPAATMGILAILSSFALSIGIAFMDKYPNGAEHILGFVIADLILVGGLSAIAWGLSKIGDKLIIGGLCLLAIVGIAALSAVVIGMIAKIGEKYDLKKTWIVMGQIGVLIMGLVGIAAGLGAIAMTGIGLGIIAAGIGLLGSIVGVAYLAGEAMKAIGEAMLTMEKVKGFDPEPIIGGIKDFLKIADALEPIADKSDKIIDASRAVSYLSKALSKISEAVKNYAELKVPIYKGTNITGYRQLKKEDFKSAANNVKIVITTLGNAVIDTYESNPEIFETNWLGTSKFSKVVTSLSKLGPMISTIARSIKNYAELKFDEDQQGKNLDKNIFKIASDNIKLVIETLGQTIMDSYDAHPDMFETNFFGTSVYSKVVTSLSKLGSMISNISKSVADYSSLQVPVYENGQLTDKKRQLTKTDFENASENIQLIINTLGNAIIEAYESHPDYYDTTGGIFGFGGSSPFTKTIDANMKLSKLITNISKAVIGFAEGKIPTGYNADGTATGYESLNQRHFNKAAVSINKVITVLGQAVMDSGENMNKILSPKKFKKIVDAQTTLGDLISKISNAVLNLSSGKVPTGYNADGSATGYMPLGPTHFAAASQRIQEIMDTLGKSILNAYEEHEDWFDDGEDSKFAMACQAIGSMGGMITNIANGIQAYAEMKIPVYDKNGNITSYAKITSNTFKNASKTIGDLITILGNTLMGEYKTHSDWFKDGQDSDMAKISSAIGAMGSMISSIAAGIQSYSELMIPDQWDKDGNPIHFRKMSDTEIKQSGENIKTVITSIVSAISDVYKDNINLFKLNDDGDSLFTKILDSCMTAGDVISAIAEAIKGYADLNFGDTDKLDGGIFDKASQNIAKVLENIGNAFNKTFAAHKDWFELTETSNSWLFGSKTKPAAGDPPFIKVMKGASMMGNVISTIAEAIHKYAELKFGDDNTASPDNIFDSASKNIATVLITIGNAFETVYEDNPKLFKGDNAKRVADGIVKLCVGVSSIGRIIKEFAGMKYIKEYGADGKPIYEKMTKTDFETASENIKTVLTTISTAIDEAADHKIFRNNKKINNMIDAIKKTSSILGVLTSSWKKNIDKLTEINNANVDINSIFGKLESFLTKINDLNKKLINGGEENGNILDKIFSNDNSPLENVNVLTSSLFDLVSINDQVKDIAFDKITEGLDSINSSVSKLDNINKLKSHREELNKYVKTVNNINNVKIDKMLRFVNAMNKLASKMGNLDNLTNAISENLTSVLDKLAERMTDAKETINKAETLQNKRQEKINKTIENIKSIMSQKLSIEISQVTDNNTLGGGTTTTSGGNETNTTSNSGGNSTSSMNNNSPEISTDNSTASNSSQKTGSNKRSQVITNNTIKSSNNIDEKLDQIDNAVQLIKNKLFNSTNPNIKG